MIKDFPAEEKPRERLAKYSSSALSNAELLAIILGTGIVGKNVLNLSQETLASYNLRELSRKDIKSLSRINGIGFVKACQIVACFELGRRLSSFTDDAKPVILCAEDVFKLIGARLCLEKQENLVGIYLDTRKRVIREETIFIGTLDSSIIHPREILKTAIQESAAALIIAHNHPSGDPSPSKEDISITKQVAEASKIIGIPLLDHIIVGETTFTSLRPTLFSQ